jgi:hypothetical protein
LKEFGKLVGEMPHALSSILVIFREKNRLHRVLIYVEKWKIEYVVFLNLFFSRNMTNIDDKA